MVDNWNNRYSGDCIIGSFRQKEKTSSSGPERGTKTRRANRTVINTKSQFSKEQKIQPDGLGFLIFCLNFDRIKTI